MFKFLDPVDPGASSTVPMVCYVKLNLSAQASCSWVLALATDRAQTTTTDLEQVPCPQAEPSI